MKHIYYSLCFLALLFLCTNVDAQQAMSVRTGASFQWSAPQPTPADSTVLTSITINGLVYDQLVLPDAYEMTQVGPNGHAANRIKNNGATLFSNSSLPAWDSIATDAFRDFNLNNYFECNVNGRAICGDSVAASTTDAQKQSLFYNPGILSTPGALVAVCERNANNCFYVELFGTPAGGGSDSTLLGATFVRNNSTQWGTVIAPPTANTDYWNSVRNNENTSAQGGAAIGIAMFYLNDIAPINSVVRKVTLTASTADHGDGKFFIASLRSDLGINKTIDNPRPVVGSNVTFTLVASNANAAGLYADTAVVVDDLPSGFTYVSHTSTQGTYDTASGRWDIGTLGLGELDTLTIVARVNPSGDYRNITEITGNLYDDNLSNNRDTAIAYPITPDPDINSTFVNVPVTGNVSTNDEDFPVGTTYGTPTAVPGNPDGSMPTMNPDGSYSFVSPVPGVFEFLVPVCAPGVVMPDCQVTLLTITVLDENITTNPPVANTDIASTQVNTPVTLGTLDNDAAGSIDASLVPSTVSVVDSPSNGTVTVDPTTGDITYTPNEGFIGTDTLEYQVCDDQTPQQCATALQIIQVFGNDAPNTTSAADDFAFTPLNTPVSGSVKENDTDPEGDNQTITPQTTTIPGKGTLVLDSTGAYTFTPENGFTGPVEFPYTTCDDGTPQACAMATLHILVSSNFPLNIETVNFYGQQTENRNQLFWETVNETSNEYFELYHGTSIDDMSIIHSVNSKGAGNWSYSFTHDNPSKGENYYQLSSVDINQTVTRYNVLSLFVSEQGSITIYPNPASNHLTVAVKGISFNDLKLELSDYSGRILINKNYDLTNDNFKLDVSLDGIAAGMYLLKVSDFSGAQYTFPVSKK